ncbi:hypothetical protein [Bacillus cereus]|uniref:hypothetical protein n=1 Tax=Bacillus cereus TaxID=1396 RepID=UPI000B4A6A69|nr:hypothetical protein [Bacillus cereus]
MVIATLKKTSINELNQLSSAEKESVKELLEYVESQVNAKTIFHGDKARGDQSIEKSYIDLLIISDEITDEISKSITKKTKEINKRNDFVIMAVAPANKQFLEEFHSLRKEIEEIGIIITH